jgi:sec-independent protein translocase protein TatC
MAKLPGAIQGARIVGQRFVQVRRTENPEGRMPLLDHLRELRGRVVKIALAIIAGSIVAAVFFHRIWAFIVAPYCSAVQCKAGVFGRQLQTTGPLDGFYIDVKVAIVCGVILSSPIWLFQLWAFIAPGLYAREKKWTYLFIGTSVPLFALGCFFAVTVMSRGLHVLIGFVPANAAANLTVDSYISYYITVLIGFGLCFEVPLFLVMLNMARIITHDRFKKWRRIVIFLIFVAAGIASPSPDPFTMLLLGGVIMVLVEVAELLMFLNDRRYLRSHPEMYKDLADDEVAPLDD